MVLASRTLLSTSLLCLLFALPASAQQSSTEAAPKTPRQKAKPQSEPTKAPEQAPDALRQFNAATESLVAKVSPAVVQVLVTGYGPLEENNRSDTAFIVRQHAIGSGVIVDPSG